MKSSLKSTLVMATVLLSTAPALAGNGIFGRARSDTAASKSTSGGRRSLFDVFSGNEARPAVSGSSMNHGAQWNASTSHSTSDSNFLTRTREFLMPWTKSEPAPMSPTGTRRVYKGSTPPEMREQPSRGPFSWLFGGAEEPRQPETVQDFLDQPRPGSIR